MRRRLAVVAILALAFAAPALADIAAKTVNIIYKARKAVPLSANDPTGTTDGTGGYPLVTTGTTGLGGQAGSQVTHAWCELTTQGTGITGGSLRWWRMSADGGWVAFGGLDQTITNVNEKRWGSNAVSVKGVGTRVYCQPLSVTETGAGLDAGLDVLMGFRTETPL